jgi:hypothetical protein
MYYTTNNPCLCVQSNPENPSSGSSCGEDCICICDIIVDEEDYPNICEFGTVDAYDYGHDVSACGGDEKYWSLVDYDSDFYESFSVSLAGEITWKVKETSTGVGQAVLKFNCGPYGAYAVFFAGAINPCTTIICPEGQICNPCTAGCEEDPGAANITITVTDETTT